MQMNNSRSQFELMEENLRNLGARIPNFPANSILLCRLLVHVAREMSAMFEQQIRPFGLAEPEFRVLTTLFSQPDGVAHPSDLCIRASQSPANMSRISDALVSSGLITRDLSVQDRRRMVLRMTAEGEKLVRRLLPVLFAPLRELLKEFPEAEQIEMTARLKRLGTQLAQVTPPTTAEPMV
jgi:MarR family transcriptional regulator, negative regulator of the multidrug operon emrRAB